MNSSFANSNGLAGLSGQFSNASRVLLDRALARRKGPRNASNDGTIYTNLSLVIQDAYKWHPHQSWAIISKPYLNSFPHGSSGMPGLDAVFNDLTQRYPTDFGLPANTPAPQPSSSQNASSTGNSGNASSGSAGSSAGGGQAVSTPKKSAGTWVGLAALAAAVGGGIWYFGEGDNKNKKSKTKKS